MCHGSLPALSHLVFPCRCACNVLRQWDLSRAIPRHVRDVTVFKGDILTLATNQGRIFTSGVDGSLRQGC